MDLVSTPAALRRWAAASLVANMGIVVTGGLVRVTGSGLGCSTWPQCEPGSYLPHPAAGGHAYIEFGNRLLTFALVAIAIGTLVAAWRARDGSGSPRRRVRGLAIAAAAGIPAQAVIGGISVLTGLNPWVVGVHLLPSVALIVICVLLLHEVHRLPPAETVPAARLLARVVFALGMLVMLVGVTVTGAGPNSGDGGAARNGLELVAVARVHSLGVLLLVVATIALVILTRRHPRAQRAAILVLAVEVCQGAIGYAQYALQLPAALVVLHMLGTAVFSAALANLWWLTRTPRQDQNSSGSTAAAMNTIER